jgi:two-component system, chemotaxis family, chemotaxis protein CheY
MNKLLIVDDSTTIRRIILRVLRESELDVDEIVEAANGIEALARLRADRGIGLVLSDVNMPEMNGVDFVRAVRAVYPKERLPVIMLTTESGQAMTLGALDEGANGYVCKPFTPDSIRTALEPYVG